MINKFKKMKQILGVSLVIIAFFDNAQNFNTDPIIGCSVKSNTFNCYE